MRRSGKSRRAPEQFSLSFLDVICCGFGAVILLLMITKTVEPQIIEASKINLEGRLAKLEEELFELRGETRILNRDLNAKQEQLSEYKERIAILRGQLASARSSYETLETQNASDVEILGQLSQARQSLTDEMQRLLGLKYLPKNQLIGGIPVDSEYIIFVIDTSGSMYSYAWGRVLEEINATLSIYPEVKGIQVMNDMGNYLFPRYRGEWIEDSPARRRSILTRLRSWNVFSNSSPVEGITQAIRSFYDGKKRISIYVFGDDFIVRTMSRIQRGAGATESCCRAGGPAHSTDDQHRGHSHFTNQYCIGPAIDNVISIDTAVQVEQAGVVDINRVAGTPD